MEICIEFLLKIKNMKNMIETIIVLAAIASVVGVSACVYSKRRKKFTDSDIQYIDTLKLEDVLDWCDKNLNTQKKAFLRILPNEGTLKAFSNSLKLDKKDLAKCIYIIVIEDGTNKVLLRKLVIPSHISQELAVLKKGEMYVVPIEK